MPILVVVALLLLALGALVYAFFIAGRDDDLSLVDRMHNRVAYRSDLSAGPIDGLFKRLDAALDPDADFTVEPTGGLNRFHSDAYQAVMEEIQGRGLDQILPFAETWSRAPAPHKRATAAELVGALSDEEVSSVTLSRATALILRLAADRDPRVVIAALQALRARHGEPYPEQVLAKVHALCASHKDEMIRLAFVDQLFPLAPDTEQGYAAVIAMAPDAAPIVRRAVCFKIGELAAMSNYDSPALRAALASRLDDSDAEVRSFAIEGLALRQDARATPALARDLVLCAEGVADKDDRTEPVTEADKQARLAKQRNTMKIFGAMNQLVSAAAAMPDRRLIPGLQALSACFPTCNSGMFWPRASGRRNRQRNAPRLPGVPSRSQRQTMPTASGGRCRTRLRRAFTRSGAHCRKRWRRLLRHPLRASMTRP